MKEVIFLKKRIISIFFVFLVVLSSAATAYAASPYVAQVVPSISFQGTTAKCSVFIVADKSSDSIDATIKLWQGNRCVKTWNDSSTGDLDFSGKIKVTKGKNYELTVDATISGKKLQRFSIEGTCP